MKKFLLVLCMAACILGLTACGSKSESKKSTNADVETVKAQVNSIIDQWNTFDVASLEAELEMLKASDATEEDIKNVENWIAAKKVAGEFEELGEVNVTITDEETVASVRGKYSKNDLDIVVTFGSVDGQATLKLTADKVLTLSEKMTRAGMNTLMGMGTVFLVLIFMSFVISFFAVIPKIQEKMANKKSANVTNEVVVNNQVAEEMNDDDLADDLELVAVVTAAIMASLGDEVPSDGLVVKSIRKVNKKNWQRA